MDTCWGNFSSKFDGGRLEFHLPRVRLDHLPQSAKYILFFIVIQYLRVLQHTNRSYQLSGEDAERLEGVKAGLSKINKEVCDGLIVIGKS